MSTDLLPFAYEGAELRSFLVDDEPWFVAADVARILEYRMASDLTRRLDEDDRGTRQVRTPSGEQQMTIISEAGFYAAILGSQSDRAKPVKRWLTHEVLPTIRKTGGAYIAPGSQAELDLTNPDTALDKLIEVAQVAKAERSRRIELEAKVEADAPKVNYVELYVADSDLIRFRTVAANNDVPEQWMRDLLVEKGWIYIETERRWSNTKNCMEIRRRYSAYAHKRQYFRPVEVHESPRFKGEVFHTLKVTPAGAEAISRLIARGRAA